MAGLLGSCEPAHFARQCRPERTVSAGRASHSHCRFPRLLPADPFCDLLQAHADRFRGPSVPQLAPEAESQGLRPP
eukprot:9315128-Alexandrium_andersonii.AAC.1